MYAYEYNNSFIFSIKGLRLLSFLLWYMSQWKQEGEDLSSLCVRVHFFVLKCYKSINCICLYNEKDYKANKGIKYKSIFIFEMLEETAVEGSRSASYPEDQQGQQ